MEAGDGRKKRAQATRGGGQQREPAASGGQQGGAGERVGGTRTADPGQLGERLAGLTRGTRLIAAPGTGPDLPPEHPVCAEPERRGAARAAGGGDPSEPPSSACSF